MKKKAKMEPIVRRIHKISTDYVDYLNAIGNECAYTDRMIEAIIEEAKKLEKAYEYFFAH